MPTDDRLLRTLQRRLAIQSPELRPTLDQACSLVAETLGADKVDVFMFESDTDSLAAMGTSETPMGQEQHQAGLNRPPIGGDGPTVKVFQTGIPYRTGRYDQDPDRLEAVSQRLGVASMIDVSLDVNGERRGVLQADSRHPDYFTARDLDFLFAVSGWIGIVTHRAELFEQVTRDAEQRGRRQAGDERRRIIRREREVVVLLAQGFTNDQIAERLVLERGTVGNHVAHILRTLGISRRAQIAVGAVYSGLYDLQTAWISALTQVTSGTGRKVPGRSP